jgi:hypothetical protein
MWVCCVCLVGATLRRGRRGQWDIGQVSHVLWCAVCVCVSVRFVLGVGVGCP